MITQFHAEQSNEHLLHATNSYPPYRQKLHDFEDLHHLTLNTHDHLIHTDAGLIRMHSFHDQHHQVVATATAFFYMDPDYQEVHEFHFVPTNLPAMHAEQWSRFLHHDAHTTAAAKTPSHTKGN